MGIRADRVILTDTAVAQLDSLAASPDPRHQSVVRRVHSLKAALLTDALHGEVVPPPRIPRALVAKHGVENLYVVDLPSFWRLLYTLVRYDRGRVVAILEIVDHRVYDRWFPGRGH
jgi:hypothetical protein